MAEWRVVPLNADEIKRRLASVIEGWSWFEEVQHTIPHGVAKDIANDLMEECPSAIAWPAEYLDSLCPLCDKPLGDHTHDGRCPVHNGGSPATTERAG